MKCADLVNLSTTTHIESYCFCVRGKPTTKSVLMSSHFHVITWIFCSKPPYLWCSAFTCWPFGHLATNSAMSFFKPSHQNTSLRLHLCRTWMNGVMGPTIFLKNPAPQTIYIGNTQPFLTPQNTPPPKENDSLCFPRTDFFQLHQWLITVLFGHHLNHQV